MLFRPPSEADSYILQATIGCSWNKCTYCVMYRDKTFRLRELSESLEDLKTASGVVGRRVEKIFVADGDALIMPMDYWTAILSDAHRLFPKLRRVSCYALASNILEKGVERLRELRKLGLRLLYIGPESGDEITLKRIVKGSTSSEHVQAARMAHEAGLQISVIALLGVGGVARSQEHAEATADLVTRMDPEYFAALTTSVIPGSPLHRMQQRGKFELPSVERMLSELRTIVDRTRPTRALFRTNHASNYLPLEGFLPRDREQITSVIDKALDGKIRLRPEWMRGL
ncbi:MAG: radical SAM protein [Deltaproteobacteria bacterium]|nr:radical SAM protein [Deltaproteobacteria bacterium]